MLRSSVPKKKKNVQNTLNQEKYIYFIKKKKKSIHTAE